MLIVDFEIIETLRLLWKAFANWCHELYSNRNICILGARLTRNIPVGEIWVFYLKKLRREKWKGRESSSRADQLICSRRDRIPPPGRAQQSQAEET